VLAVRSSLRSRTGSGGEDIQRESPRTRANTTASKREFPRNEVPPPNKKYDHRYGQITNPATRGNRPRSTGPVLRPQGTIPQPGTYRTRQQYTYDFKRKNAGEINPRFRNVCSSGDYFQNQSSPRGRSNTIGVRSSPTSQSPRTRARTSGRLPQPSVARGRSQTVDLRSTSRNGSAGSLEEAGLAGPAPRFKRPQPRHTAPRFGGPRARKVDQNGYDIVPSLSSSAGRSTSVLSIESTLDLAQRHSLSDIKETTPNTFNVLQDTVKLLNDWMQEIELEG